MFLADPEFSEDTVYPDERARLPRHGYAGFAEAQILPLGRVHVPELQGSNGSLWARRVLLPLEDWKDIDGDLGYHLPRSG